MSNIYIYSREIYEQLPLVKLEGKEIIRIHNLNDKKWYPNIEERKLILFFDDLKLNNISLIDKIKAQLNLTCKCFKEEHVKKN